MYHGSHTSIVQQKLFNIYNNKNVSCSPNQHIRMISEWLCDTEDWSDDAENTALPSQELMTF